MKKIRKEINQRMKMLFMDNFKSQEECAEVWQSIMHLEGTCIHGYLIDEIYMDSDSGGNYFIMTVYSDTENDYVAPLSNFLQYTTLVIFGDHNNPQTSELFDEILMSA